MTIFHIFQTYINWFIYVFIMFRMYPPTYNYVVLVVHACIYLNTISTNTKKKK